VIDETRRGDRSADSLVDEANHLEDTVAVVRPRGDTVTHLHGGRRFRRTAVDLDMTAVTRVGGLAAGRVDADRPQPAIDSRPLVRRRRTDRLLLRAHRRGHPRARTITVRPRAYAAAAHASTTTMVIGRNQAWSSTERPPSGEPSTRCDASAGALGSTGADRTRSVRCPSGAGGRTIRPCPDGPTFESDSR
jgi:hypothetical protein